MQKQPLPKALTCPATGVGRPPDLQGGDHRSSAVHDRPGPGGCSQTRALLPGTLACPCEIAMPGQPSSVRRRCPLDLDKKVTCYLSAEGFLMGPPAGQQPAEPRESRRAGARAGRWAGIWGQDYDEVPWRAEPEPGLGNGGPRKARGPVLSRLAGPRWNGRRSATASATSSASFKQEFQDGWADRGTPTNWLVNGKPLGR